MPLANPARDAARVLVCSLHMYFEENHDNVRYESR